MNYIVIDIFEKSIATKIKRHYDKNFDWKSKWGRSFNDDVFIEHRGKPTKNGDVSMATSAVDIGMTSVVKVPIMSTIAVFLLIQYFYKEIIFWRTCKLYKVKLSKKSEVIHFCYLHILPFKKCKNFLYSWSLLDKKILYFVHPILILLNQSHASGHLDWVEKEMINGPKTQISISKFILANVWQPWIIRYDVTYALMSVGSWSF